MSRAVMPATMSRQRLMYSGKSPLVRQGFDRMPKLLCNQCAIIINTVKRVISDHKLSSRFRTRYLKEFSAPTVLFRRQPFTKLSQGHCTSDLVINYGFARLMFSPRLISSSLRPNNTDACKNLGWIYCQKFPPLTWKPIIICAQHQLT